MDAKMTPTPFKDPLFIDLLRKAAHELRFLLKRGYPMTSCIRFIGNHHQLPTAGRQALLRSHSRYVTSKDRIKKCVSPDKLQGARVAIDGYNVILTVETALMGKPLFMSSDRTIRDIRTVGGNYKYTSISQKGVELIFEALKSARVAEVNWVFDKPVSGSGEMARLIRNWEPERDQKPGMSDKGNGAETSPTTHEMTILITAETASSADRKLANISNNDPKTLIASSDAPLLDRVHRWFNLAELTILPLIQCGKTYRKKAVMYYPINLVSPI